MSFLLAEDYATPEELEEEIEEEFVYDDPTAKEWVNMITGELGVCQEKKEDTEFNNFTSCDRHKMLCMRMPTMLEDVARSIPYPKNYAPKIGLPYWKEQRLDQKLQIPHAPKGAVVLTRGKVGKYLWRLPPGGDFILYDPYNIEVDMSYEDLHDEYLKEYFKQDVLFQQLLSNEYVTEDRWAICTPKQLNDYRRYLNRYHMTLVRKTIEEQRAVQKENYEIEEMKAYTRERVEKIMIMSALEEIRKKRREEARKEREAYIQSIHDKIKMREVKYEQLMMEREAAKLEKQRKGEEQKELNKIKLLIKWEVARIKRRRVVKKMQKKEKACKKILKKLEIEKEKAKKDEINRRWHMKLDAQYKRIPEEKRLIELNKETFKQNVEIRNQMAAKNQKKVEAKSADVLLKARQAREDIKKQERYKHMYKVLKKAWMEQQNDTDPRIEEYRINKTFQTALAESINMPGEGPDRFNVLMRTRMRMLTESNLSMQVSYAVEVVIETAIDSYHQKKLTLILNELVDKVKKYGEDKLKVLKGQFMYHRLGYKPPEICTPRPKKSTRESHVNFGEEEDEEELAAIYGDRAVEEQEKATKLGKVPTEFKHLLFNTEKNKYFDPTEDFALRHTPKSIKTRQATPTPSTEDLVKESIIENNPEDIEPHDYSVEGEMRIRKQDWKTFKYIAKELYNKAVSLMENVIEPSTRVASITKLTSLRGSTVEEAAEKLSKLMLNFEKCQWIKSQDFVWSSSVIAREATKQIYPSKEFERGPNEETKRTKLIWCKSKYLEEVYY